MSDSSKDRATKESHRLVCAGKGPDQTLASFAEPATHAAITRIIQRLSSNPSDIREIALDGLELGPVREILDLGCGFGFMSETVLERAGPGARLTGVDACEENRGVFLKLAAKPGQSVEFHGLRLERELPWPGRSFDLVVASYSLYFFPGLLGEIARVLRPDGLFVTTTHRQDSLRALCRLAGVEETGSALLALVRQFPAENGRAKLLEFFDRVQKIDFPNELSFDARHRSELLAYVRFKLPFLRPDADPAAGLPAELEERVNEVLNRDGRFVMDKTDAIFRCWGPHAQ